MSAYQPNHIPAKSRWMLSILALGILAYGAWGLWGNDLYVRGRNGPGIHMHGAAAWAMFGAMACASALLLLVVVDHYDRRNNERDYQRWADGLGKMLGTLFVLALVLHLMQVAGAPRAPRVAMAAAHPAAATTVIKGVDFTMRQRAIANRAPSPEVDAYEDAVDPPIRAAAFACQLSGQSAYGGYTRFVVLGRVGPAGDLTELSVQPLTAFADCVADKLNGARLPTPPATADADGFPLLFIFTIER